MRHVSWDKTPILSDVRCQIAKDRCHKDDRIEILSDVPSAEKFCPSARWLSRRTLSRGRTGLYFETVSGGHPTGKLIEGDPEQPHDLRGNLPGSRTDQSLIDGRKLEHKGYRGSS